MRYYVRTRIYVLGHKTPFSEPFVSIVRHVNGLAKAFSFYQALQTVERFRVHHRFQMEVNGELGFSAEFEIVPA